MTSSREHHKIVLLGPSGVGKYTYALSIIFENPYHNISLKF